MRVDPEFDRFVGGLDLDGVDVIIAVRFAVSRVARQPHVIYQFCPEWLGTHLALKLCLLRIE